MIKNKKIKRIFHTYDKWECYPAGFYDNQKSGSSDEECIGKYADLLRDLVSFDDALTRVRSEWVNSCEHYLTNENMNRIAWLGQASLCLILGIPSKYRSGYFLLTEAERKAADELALIHLNIWLIQHGYEKTDLEGAGVSARSNIY